MKHMQLVALIAILLNASAVVAQENLYAFHQVNTTTSSTIESPAVPTDFKLEVAPVNQEELVFRVTVENPGSERVILSIKDANNVTLHQESLPATLVYKARFNLQELQDGNYTFEIRKGRTRLAEKTIGIKTETSVNRTISVQ